jgi:hypothetical protein
MGFNGSLADFLNQPIPPVQWLIEDFVPRQGVVLLHAKTSIGKSPLIWKMAQCISEGTDFFGHKVRETGAALIVELDTPDALVQPRLKLLNPVPKRVAYCNLYPGINSLDLSGTPSAVFTNHGANTKPVVVFVNTLRRCHIADDKDSSIPSQVYGVWQKLFPHAAIIFVHHDKKAQIINGIEIEAGDQAFSGSQHWQDDAQIALHLISTGKKERNVRLEVTKSQVGAVPDPLKLQLSEDGTNWLDTGTPAIQEAYNKLDPTLPKMARYEKVAADLKVSTKTVRRALSIGQDPKSDVHSDITNNDGPKLVGHDKIGHPISI